MMSRQVSNHELSYWLAINQTLLIGPTRWQRLLDYFSSMEAVWRAPLDHLEKAGLETRIAEKFLSRRRVLEPEEVLAEIQKNNINIITILDANYPRLLKEIYAPPPLLYYWGNLDLNNEYPVAVVGSRKTTAYGRQITHQLVTDITNRGLVTISGLALGIDTIVHQATIQAGGTTIAVLGCGLDKIYPARNQQLAEKIIQDGGAVIAEFPLGTPPFKSNFPRRNRIIAGLALGVLITEAGEKSGALITARHALEQNREVFAVPGSIYNDQAVGPHHLIKQGAKMVTTIDDILETLNLEKASQFKAVRTINPESKAERMLLDLLPAQPIHVDKLARSARLDISTINSLLTMMEMKGLVKNIGQQTYIKL